MKQKKEFKQIDLNGKVWGEFNLDEIPKEEKGLRILLKRTSRGDCVKFTGQTWLMKVTD